MENETKTKNRKKLAIKITAITLASLIVIFVVVAFAVCRVLINDMFGRADTDFALSTYYTAEELTKYEKTPIEFDSFGNTLRGHIWGRNDRKKLVIISHGIGNSANGYYTEMKYFYDNGFRVLTYDNTGSCSSDGKGTTGLSQSDLDLHNALTFVENHDELKDLPVYLFGHSWGGHAVTAVLNFEHKNIKAVASVAGYDSNGGIMLEWMKNKMGMGGGAYIIFPFASVCALADAHGAYYNTGVGGINKSDLPVLIVQGGKDETVWEDSLYNHRDEIKNDKVEYLFFPEGTHSGVLNPDDPQIIEYREQKQAEYDKLNEEYDGNIPYETEKEFFANIDKDKFNGPNNATMSEVLKFFQKYGA